MPNLTAQVSTTIAAPVAAVWDALTNPQIIKQYMFGADVVSDWQAGSPIVWRGEYQGRQEEREHSAKNWSMMLDRLKAVAENRDHG